ncbi:MAG: cytochrome c1 [Rhodospirillales bacterium]|nr:cytochrome c1 [Rhodospirillales bacterium]MSP79758.1 cytochrome c1 [Rhodospirillales bacterium]
MHKSLLAAALAFLLAAPAAPATAAGAAKPPEQAWSFDGVFGTFDRASLRRGLIVYRQVCSSCHSLSLVAYRHLAGVNFSADEIKAIAATVEVTDGPNDQGEMFQRPGRPADKFKAPFANENAARAANNGAHPPDLSLMIKARKGGANYVHALLAGYKDPPAGFQLTDGMSYNTHFPGQQIAMGAPLNEGSVDYPDGTKASVEQMARDVTTFLAWTAEPEMEARKRLGLKVLLFLLVLTGMLYALKRMIWSDLH